MALPPVVSIDVARQLYRQNKPFQVRLEQRDRNTNTDKWWSITWDSASTLCDVNHGRRGSLGRKTPFRKPISEVFSKARDKLNEGYDYSSSTSRTFPKPPAPTPPPALTGILAEIRAIYQIAADHFQAYDENSLLLMDLDADTAVSLHKANSFQISMRTL